MIRSSTFAIAHLIRLKMILSNLWKTLEVSFQVDMRALHWWLYDSKPKHKNIQVTVSFKQRFLSLVDILHRLQWSEYCQGTLGKQGSYMLQVVQLIERLHQKPIYHKIFFLIENTITENDKNIDLTEGDLQKITETFKLDWDPNLFDAMDVSPCQQQCFFTNITYQTPDYAWLASYALILPKCFLNDGFQSLSNFIKCHTMAKIPR